MGDPVSPAAVPDAGGLHPLARGRFRAALVAAGFTLHGQEANGNQRWDAKVIARWRDANTAAKREAAHPTRIGL